MHTPGTATQLSMTNHLDMATPLSLTDEATMRVLNDISPLAGLIQSKFEQAKMARRPHELRWRNAWMNFRGKPGSTTFISTEKSKAFIKISKTKTIAVYSQMTEVLFPNDTIPIELAASPEPLGAPEYAHIDPEDAVVDEAGMASEAQGMDFVGYPGDGKDLKPGETISSRVMTWVREKVGQMAKIKEGPGTNPNRIILKPAEEAAMYANKRVQDQFAEMNAVKRFREGCFECPLLGTAVMKGPFTVNKEIPSWDNEGTYRGIPKAVPRLRAVSIWNIYPDSEARTEEEIEWLIERHKLSASQMTGLKKMPGFRASAIEIILQRNPNYVNEDFENYLNENSQTVSNDRYEVLEYWGPVSKIIADQMGAKFPFPWPEGVDELHVNAWICGGEWLRCVVNPFQPFRLPYYFVPFEYNPYSPFGVGVVENMEDTQELMNGFVRLAVDNAVLSGSIMLEVDESVMMVGQSYDISVGKIWRKSTTTQQAAIRPITIPNTSQANLQMFDAFRRLADEATGTPSFSHGMTGVQGVGRTAGGISMLMNAASQAIKTVVKNFDDHWFEPIGKAMYYWNLANDFDKRLLGDITTVAKGSASLMQKEVKSQRLLQFGQIVASNPMAAAWINWKQWNIELARAMEVDDKTIINKPDEYQLQLQMMQMMQAKAAGAPGQAAPGEAPAPSAPGGQPIAAPAQPGQQGFTGTPQAQGEANGTGQSGLTG